MIDVEPNQNSDSLLIIFGIRSEHIHEAINQRDKAILDPGVNRLIAIRWISDHEALLIDSEVTGKRREGDDIVIERIRPMLALRLEASLPAGRIDRNSDLEPLMITVAESFGQPISFHSTASPVVLYTGPWEQNYVRIIGGQAEQEVLVLATVTPSTQTVFGGWAFNLSKYMGWLGRNRIEEPTRAIRIDERNSWNPADNEPPVVFSGEFTSDSLRRFGIREEQAMEAISLPDKTDVLEFYDFRIRLHSKELRTNPPSTILVVESVNEAKRSVDIAFRIYPQLVKGIQEPRPLEILRQLTNSFGFMIRVGSQTGKILLGERFDFRGTLMEFLEPIRGSMIQQMYFKIDEGPLPKAYCPLAYCIDTDLYSDWLRASARKVN